MQLLWRYAASEAPEHEERQLTSLRLLGKAFLPQQVRIEAPETDDSTGATPKCFYQSWLFPVSQAFQLVYDFDQPLKPPLMVGCGAVFRANQIFVIRFSEFSYFAPQLFDTLRDQSRHRKHPFTLLPICLRPR